LTSTQLKVIYSGATWRQPATVETKHGLAKNIYYLTCYGSR